MLRRKRRVQHKPYDWGLPDNALTWLMREFLDAGRATALSERTIVYRHRALRRFIVWCAQRGIEQPQAVSLAVIERYQRYLYHYRKADGQPLSWSTQNAEVVPLKSFFRWLTRMRHIPYNPTSEIEMPRKPLSIPRYVFSVSEIETILNQADITTPIGLRDRAIMETLYSSGIRRMELINLNETDVDVIHKRLRIIEGKNRKDRMVPIGARACAWLMRYREEVRPQLYGPHHDGAFFLNEYGERCVRNRLGDQVKQYIDRAGFSVPGSCHLFRHACATHMLENGADIRYIQELLGHSNLNTTQIYTRVSILKLQQIHEATHPARLSRQAGDDACAEVDGDAAEALLNALADEEVEDDTPKQT
jgi:integrase/recombinase XerD